MSVSFLRRDRNGMDPDGRAGGEELRGVGTGEAVITIYYMKRSIFNKRKNKFICELAR